MSAALERVPHRKGQGKGNPGASGYERTEHDWYVEPAWAVDGLLDVEAFEGEPVFDPACGGGMIPTRCKARGIAASGSDIVARGFGYRADFFGLAGPFPNIITNPPFKLAVPFTLHALSRTTGKVAVLQQLSWLEGTRRGHALFDAWPLARVWVFRRRVSMPPGDAAVSAEGGKKAFAWFVWERGHCGPWSGGWIA